MTVIRSGARALVHPPRTLVTTFRQPIPNGLQPGWASWPGTYKEKKRIKTIDTAARDRTIYTKAVNFRNSKREVKNHVQDGKR